MLAWTMARSLLILLLFTCGLLALAPAAAAETPRRIAIAY